MIEQTDSTSNQASGNPVEQIAEMLIEEEKPEPTENAAEEEAAEESEGSEESSEEISEEPSEEDAAPAEHEAAVDDDVTWSGVLGVDDARIALDDDGNFKGVNVKIDGESSNVDLNTLISGYQTAKSTTQRSQALANERRQFEEESNQVAQIFKQRLGEAEELTKLLQQKMVSDYEGIDWHKLRVDNPAEYAATLQDFEAKKSEVGHLMEKLQEEKKVVAEKQQQSMEVKKQEYFQEQVRRTLERFPTWKDKEVATKAFTEMREFAKEYGYSDEEFSEIADSRAIAIIQAALQARNAEKLVERKITKPVPKFHRATNARRAKPKQTKLDKLIKRASSERGANKRRAQTDAVAELLLSGK